MGIFPNTVNTDYNLGQPDLLTKTKINCFIGESGRTVKCEYRTIDEDPNSTYLDVWTLRKNMKIVDQDVDFDKLIQRNNMSITD